MVTKKVGEITCYINRPGVQSGAAAMDQRIARIPVYFVGGIPAVTEIIKVDRDYYVKVEDNPLRYVLKTFSKGSLVESIGGNNGAHNARRNKRRK